MAGETVLVIDENGARTEMFRRRLLAEGYRVRTAQNGVAALTLPDETVHVVFLHAHLSVVDGRDMAARLRGDRRMWRAALCLLVPEEEQHPWAGPDLSGAHDFLVVPCSAEALAGKARELCRIAHAQEEANARIHESVSAYVDERVEESFRGLLEARAEAMVDSLATGMAEMLEVRGREMMKERVTEIIDQGNRQKLAELVRDASIDIFSEVAEEAVSRVASPILEKKSEEMLRALEDEEIPEMVARQAEEELSKRMNQMVDRMVSTAREQMFQALVQEVGRVTERIAAKVVPDLVQKILPGHVGPIVREAMKRDRAS